MRFSGWYQGVMMPYASIRKLWPLLVLAGLGVVAFDWFVLPTLGVVEVMPIFDRTELLGYGLICCGLMWALGPISEM